jgi:hypothetical protein
MFDLTMEFKLSACNTNHDDRDNTCWLLEAGFEEKDITEELRLQFKKCFSYLFTKFIKTNVIPEEDQPFPLGL